ncbi:hypothetical protein A9Q83_10100 [Alphaproteobacteria bacterium 46_93_T64]|nr:hypothetical protein A9Q83_10100 [Alphaproteobacteria bacterium 46_93_T64]
MNDLDKNLESVNRWVDLILEFSVKYGFQILGALAFFAFGFMVANWIGNRISKIALAKNIDLTLSQFIGSTTKLILMILLVIITLGNFGISIAPLIALAGAVSLGITLALQGPISNFGAGISIILTRPFVVGNVITVLGVNGVVEKITLGITFLTGEDGEQIAIPNKEIVGQVIVNSHETRILESGFCVPADVDTEKLISAIESILNTTDGITKEPTPQVGIHDFTYGGLVIGFRAWVPGSSYFQIRYDVNKQILAAMQKMDIKLLTPSVSALALPTHNTSTSSADIARPQST